ncbi:tetratricopeptide repeat protein, partial [Rhabdobacter roseus]
MSQETAFKTTQIGFYNPGRLSDVEIERAFITRIKILEYLIQSITAETPDTIPQHYLIIGQRGMGKSTLLHRIAVELRKEKYRASFIPLTFPEEQYNVDRLSKFWLNCLDALADALERSGHTNLLSQLDNDINQWATQARNITAPQMYAHFAQWTQRLGRRPVLLVDNLSLIFDRLSKEEHHQLRAILMDQGGPILVGASAHTLADTVDYAAPFYDAFQIQYLKKLTYEETLDVLRNLAELTNNPAFINTMYAQRGRLRTLYQLTGGTPRTVVMLYPLIQSGFSINIQTDLEGLMDVMTPLYKARFEELSEQMQVILDAVALHWDPIALEELRQITQLENQQIAPQLTRLTEVGWIERLKAYQKKGQAYQISERFFNIWYLMRRSSRRQKKELLCLTKFLVTLYGKELPQIAEHALGNSAAHRDHVSVQLALADGIQDAELATRLRNKSYQELLGMAKTDKTIFKDFEIPKEYISEKEKELTDRALELLTNENGPEALAAFQDILDINPENAFAWYVIGYLNQIHFKNYPQSETAYLKATQLDERAAPWYMLGTLYQDDLARYQEAEAAYLKAIQLDENDPDSWYRLGTLYQDHLRRYQDAETAYLKAIQLDKNDPDSWYRLGTLYQDHLRRYQDAETAYLKAI